MSHQMPKYSSASPGTRNPPKSKAKVTLPADRESESVPPVIEDFVKTLAELQTEVVLSALQGSILIQTKGTNMPERKLTAAAALDQAKRLNKKHLEEQQEDVVKQVEGIRAQVKLEELQKFDDDFDDWVSPEG